MREQASWARGACEWLKVSLGVFHYNTCFIWLHTPHKRGPIPRVTRKLTYKPTGVLWILNNSSLPFLSFPFLSFSVFFSFFAWGEVHAYLYIHGSIGGKLHEEVATTLLIGCSRSRVSRVLALIGGINKYRRLKVGDHFRDALERPYWLALFNCTILTSRRLFGYSNFS
jgi:hypothetical protein